MTSSSIENFSALSRRSRMLKIWIATLVSFIAGILVSGTSVWLYESGRTQDRRQAVADVTNQVADEIHDHLNRSLSASYALAAIVRQGNGTIHNFPQLAKEMLGLYPGISSLQIAPRGIITQVFPLEGNQKAIGHNLLEDTKRNKEALLAVRTKSLTLAGPFDLIQGGKAIIGRLPIFFTDPKGAQYFWGFTTVLIRIPDFISVTNIEKISAKDYSYELSRIHPDSGLKDVFSSAGRPLKAPVSQKIPVPNGEWTLAVEPMSGWYSPSAILIETLFILLFSSISALTVWRLTRQPLILQTTVEERTRELSEANAMLQAEIKERKHAEEAIKESEQRFRMLVDNSIDIIFLLDANGVFRFVSPAWEKHFGCPVSEVFSRNFAEFVHPDDVAPFTEYMMKVMATDIAATSPLYRVRQINGSWRSCIANGSRYKDVTGSQLFLGIGRDISDQVRAEEERIQLEKQMLHAQKLESLGVLAGGIAHDFNNILMAIIGNADLALMRVNKESPAVENLHRIEQAAARAADLAKQMLAYSGKGRFVIESLNLNILLEEMLHMLEVSISKKAVLRLNPYRPLPSVEADATQMRQIIMNLVINASEAISDKSGVIAITTGCMDCDRTYLKDVWLDENLTDGLYVYLEIADTGCGMDKETMAKLFDPFFTTKFTGRGLGMAAVLGIVRGHKGAIKVYSEPGKGTSFKILLPASDRPAELFNHDSHTDNWQGSGTVLLVDDEETVRGIGAEMLKELGFTVVTADDGREALEIFISNPDIAFVILDLTMPHMDGEQCFRELRQLKPDVKVIMSSGYNEQEVTRKFVGKGLAGFIQKPYKLSELKEAVRRM